jgi:hypothetical protein
MTLKSSHFWTVWIVPIGTFVIISATALGFNSFKAISDNDTLTSILFSALVCGLWKGRREKSAARKKLPIDGSRPMDNNIQFTQMFYFSTWKLYRDIISSLFLIFCGIFVLSAKIEIYLLPTILIVLGMSEILKAGKRLNKRKPQFQLSDTFIWTAKLGAIERKGIKKMLFKKVRSAQAFVGPAYWLEIYLGYNDGDYADDSVYLNNIKDYRAILKTLNPKTDTNAPWQQVISSYLE